MKSEAKESQDEKIDYLIKKMDETQSQRKRDNALSKIDGLYTVLLALVTFFTGIIISQHNLMLNKDLIILEFFIVTIVFSLIFSAYSGYKGMILDSMDNRILAWCLLLSSLSLLFIFGILVTFVEVFNIRPIISLAIGFVSGIIFFIIQPLISKKFTIWIEIKFMNLLGQKISVWRNIKNGIIIKILYIFFISGATSLIISSLGR